MTRLIAAELFKLRTTRTFYGMVLGALGIVLVIVIPVSLIAPFDEPGSRPLHDSLAFAGFAQVFSLLLGILSVTSEYRHGTVTPSLLTVPDRLRLAIAKLGGSVAVGLALGAVTVGITWAVVAGFLAARGIDTRTSGSEAVKIAIGTTLATGLYAALGVGLGGLTRNQVGAIVGSLVYLFVIEGILIQLIPGVNDTVPKYDIGGAAGGLSGTSGGPGAPDVLGQVPGGLLLTAYCAAFFVLGVLMMRRRDVSA